MWFLMFWRTFHRFFLTKSCSLLFDFLASAAFFYKRCSYPQLLLEESLAFILDMVSTRFTLYTLVLLYKKTVHTHIYHDFQIIIKPSSIKFSRLKNLSLLILHKRGCSISWVHNPSLAAVHSLALPSWLPTNKPILHPTVCLRK